MNVIKTKIINVMRTAYAQINMAAMNVNVKMVIKEMATTVLVS